MSEVQGSEFNFDDLTPIQIPVRYGGHVYLLCEADGEAGTKFRNWTFAAVRASKEGKEFGVHGFADREPLLVHLCLFEAEDHGGELRRKMVDGENGDSHPVRVPEATIRTWPARIVKQLYEKAEEISELTEVRGTLKSLREQRDKLNEHIESMSQQEESLGNAQ